MSDVSGKSATDATLRFSTRQIEQLAKAASVSMDEIRSALRNMGKFGNNFFYTLGRVHALQHPEVSRIEDKKMRNNVIGQYACDLESTWRGDKAVVAMVNVGVRQAKTGKAERDEPKFMSWLDSVRSYLKPNPESAPSSPAVRV